VSFQSLIQAHPGLSLFDAQSSRRLRLVSGYFLLVGFLGAVVGPVSVLVGFLAFPAFRSHSYPLLVAVAVSEVVFAGWLLAGILLARRQKRGALLAFVVLLYQILGRMGHAGNASPYLIFGVIGMLALLSILGELR
jgi:MFS family permease